MIVGSIPGAVGAWLPVDLLVSQSRQARETFAIDYSASDGSGVAGVDYLAAPGTLHFNPGDTNHTVAIQIKQDPNAAGTRTFSVRLAKADAEGAFGRNQATVTAVY